MNNKVLFALFTVLFLAMPLFAHHGTGISYDNSKAITSKASVTDFTFLNPHVRIFFDVTDQKGKVTHWSGEMANPAQFLRDGWTKRRMEKELAPGTPITVTYQVSKAQEHLPADIGAALVMKIVNEKGETIGLVRNGNGGQQ
jgi:Family of unknown function (DUF6152)